MMGLASQIFEISCQALAFLLPVGKDTAQGQGRGRILGHLVSVKNQWPHSEAPAGLQAVPADAPDWTQNSTVKAP